MTVRFQFALRREPGVVAGDAAQQAIVGVLDRGVGRGQGAQAVGDRGLRDRVEIRGLAGEADQIIVKAKLPAEDRVLEDVVVVDHGVHDRELALDVGRREAVEVKRTRLKIAAVATTREVELGQGVIRGDQREIGGRHVPHQAVIVQKVLVRHHRRVPAPHPFVREVELARRLHAAAPVEISRRVHRNGVLVELEETRGPDAIGAVEQPLAPLALQQRTLLARDRGREGEIVVGGERPVIGNRNSEPIDRARAVRRREYTGLALYRRIGCRHVREVGHRDADEFEPRVLEIQHLLALIVDDPRRLYLPFRRLRRIVLAGLAGGIDAVVEDGEIAAGALCARGGKTGLLGSIEAQRIRRSRRDSHR